MTRLSEKRDVQDALVNYLIGIGWEYLPPDEVRDFRSLRDFGSLNPERQPFLTPVARQQLTALNPGLVTLENVDDVLRRLQGVHPSMAGNEEFLHYLRGHKTVYSEAEKRERNLTLIDFDNPPCNRFTFTDCIPELLKFVQFFAACDVRIHYGATWNDSLKAFYRWKANGKDYGLENLSKTLFAQEHLLRLIQGYVIFFRADDETHKFVLRPHQIRAAERIVQRVQAGQTSEVLETSEVLHRTGLIWHTQGSGKTLTMIVAAHKLRRLPSLENPTLLAVVDRRELETQMVQNLEAFGFPTVVRAESKRHLRELLASDYRGLIVTTIHKFDRIPKHLNTCHNVVVLIDEAHRSQEGDLATYMRAALPNAFYFGFTGTPINSDQLSVSQLSDHCSLITVH